MKRYVVTGAPGAGKTSILRELARLGYAVVTEAATDVIVAAQALGEAEPWRGPGFVDTIVAVQRQRQQVAPAPGVAAQVYDRSPICTLALTWYLGRPVTGLLAAEIDRVVRAGVYDRHVLFVRPIGFVREAAYVAHGFELVDIPAGPIGERAAAIDRRFRSWRWAEEPTTLHGQPPQ